MQLTCEVLSNRTSNAGNDADVTGNLDAENAYVCTNRDGRCGPAQSLVCECSNPDQLVIGLSALASLQQTAIQKLPDSLGTHYTHDIPLPLLPILAQVFYGLDVIGSTHKSQKGPKHRLGVPVPSTGEG